MPMKGWQLLAITTASIVILVLSLIFVFGSSPDKITLSDQEKEMAVVVATEALKEDLPSNYTVGDPVVGLSIKPRRSTVDEEKRTAFVTFRSDNFSAGVVVDLDARRAVRLTESFDWMAEAPRSRGWYHESWTRRLSKMQKMSVLGILLGGACLLYWRSRRKKGADV